MAHKRTHTSDRPGTAKEVDPGATSTATSTTAMIGLKLLVFGAGAVLMGLEIAGSRVLAPYFGNSVFVWGSLIAIFLLAISVGNYLGGWLADLHPSRLALSGITIGVSLWIFALAIFAQGFCLLLVQAGFGEQSGPLVASMVLFLAPSIGMGMVSPFAIRLATSSVETVGKISGSLYALSNIGSIAGTMLTTFVLIPFIGVSAILKGLGITLLVVSLVTAPGIWARRHAMNLAFIAILTGGLLLSPESLSYEIRPGQKVLLEVSTPYHNIAVVEDTVEELRMLQFDRRYNESTVSTNPPHISSAEYTAYFHLAFLVKPEIDRTLFIGAGGAVGPRSFRMHDPKMEIDVVDIDPKVLELTRSHFYLPKAEDDPKIRTIAADGRIFVREANEPYDCIVLDAFTIGGRIPFHLVTQEYFDLCRERMTDDGVFVMNINSALEGPKAHIFRSTYRTLKLCFPEVYVFRNDATEGEPTTQSTNIMFVATKGSKPLSAEEWRERAAAYRSASYIDSRILRHLVTELVETPPDVSSAPVFTDDYAPIETMPFM